MNEQTRRLMDAFQARFADVLDDQITQLVLESRREAFAEAHEILKLRTLHQLLSGPDSEQPVLAEIPSPKAASDSPAPVSDRSSSASDTSSAALLDDQILDDQILQEIEAIREQITRNDQLLGELKPFLKTSGTRHG